MQSTNGADRLFSDAEWQRLVSDLGFTSRQAELIDGILQGWSDQQVARKLQISPHTVRAHLQRVFEAQGVTDRTALVVNIFRRFRQLSIEE
ncbi:MAG: helix-turn-helix transcriptional regulator [Pirellulaceae bacterium]|nr:helix-turn-helix transcriptional regulator [Planctomycetales bacterium]